MVWDSKRAESIRLLLLWIAVSLLYFGIAFSDLGKEHRWFLPTYPAYALLGAYVLESLQAKLGSRFSLRVSIVVMSFVLGGSPVWSVSMGLHAVPPRRGRVDVAVVGGRRCPLNGPISNSHPCE